MLGAPVKRTTMLIFLPPVGLARRAYKHVTVVSISGGDRRCVGAWSGGEAGAVGAVEGEVVDGAGRMPTLLVEVAVVAAAEDDEPVGVGGVLLDPVRQVVRVEMARRVTAGEAAGAVTL